ncbi:MAG: EpsI family protein [Aquabacterium sp.]
MIKPSLLAPTRLPIPVLLVAVSIMLGSVALAEAFKPHKYWADVIGEPHYETLVPKAFGDWVAMKYKPAVVVNPVQEENLMRLYTETYAQGFIHVPTGRVMLLSIAYGRDQTNDSQIHVPEACYQAQGFRLESEAPHDIPTAFGPVAGVRLVTTLGRERTEPLTYFIRVGDAVTRGSKERNLRRLAMALRGYRIDGMLFRVSELTPRTDASFSLQDQFIGDLLKALSPEARKRFIGQQ